MNPPSLFILLAESGATVVAYILLIAGPLLAALFFFLWRKARRTRDLMSATETSPIGQLAEGPAEVRGRTVTSEEPLTSPWRQQKCVHYCFHVEEQRSSTDSKGNTTHHWATYIKDEQTLPFLVKDDTGQAVVDSSKIKFVVEKDRGVDLQQDAPVHRDCAGTRRGGLCFRRRLEARRRLGAARRRDAADRLRQGRHSDREKFLDQGCRLWRAGAGLRRSRLRRGVHAGQLNAEKTGAWVVEPVLNIRPRRRLFPGCQSGESPLVTAPGSFRVDHEKPT